MCAGPNAPPQAIRDETNENREPQIRNPAMHDGGREADTRLGRKATSSLHVRNHRSQVMKWETPQASDMRYGFEITMYIATR
jgi:coenzyme PQQ precursor peptide PqqA